MTGHAVRRMAVIRMMIPAVRPVIVFLVMFMVVPFPLVSRVIPWWRGAGLSYLQPAPPGASGSVVHVVPLPQAVNALLDAGVGSSDVDHLAGAVLELHLQAVDLA